MVGRKLLDKLTQGHQDSDMKVQTAEVMEKARVTLHERRCFDALLSDKGLRMVQSDLKALQFTYTTKWVLPESRLHPTL